MIKNTIFMAVAALALCGCGQNGTKKTGQATGADRDGHDCIGSAGYQWSEARKDCIRPFEDGVKMLPTTQSDTGAVYAAYIVFRRNCSCPATKKPKCSTGATCPAAGTLGMSRTTTRKTSGRRMDIG